jgi:hypothetical protein
LNPHLLSGNIFIALQGTMRTALRCRATERFDAFANRVEAGILDER